MGRLKGTPSERKGKTFLEIFGNKVSEKIKNSMRKPKTNSSKMGRYKRTVKMKKDMKDRLMGKSYTEIYGKEVGDMKRKKHSESMKKKYQEGYSPLKGKLIGQNNPSCRPEVIEIIRKKAVQRMSSMPKEGTSIEIAMKKYLSDRGINFIHQYNFNDKFSCDFAIPSHKIIIECDGEYWHNYPHGTPKDSSRDKYITVCGWKVLRFWGKDILDNEDGCMEVVNEQLIK